MVLRLERLAQTPSAALRHAGKRGLELAVRVQLAFEKLTEYSAVH